MLAITAPSAILSVVMIPLPRLPGSTALAPSLPAITAFGAILPLVTAPRFSFAARDRASLQLVGADAVACGRPAATAAPPRATNSAIVAITFA